MAHLSQVVSIGAGAGSYDGRRRCSTRSFGIGGPPLVGRIGMADVKRLEAATGVFRALDYQYGGGSCRDAVHAQLACGEQLLRAEGIDAVKDRFQVALADLHNAAGLRMPGL